MLSHVAEHHASYGTPWGLSLLHNFVVLPNDEVTCCIPTSVASPTVDCEQAELFAAPEGANNGTAADIYTLGCVFFRLLHRLPQGVDARQVMVELRNRILPIAFLQQQPMASAFILAMLHPNPSSRPSVDDLLSHDMLVSAAEEFSRRKLASRGSRDRLLAEAAAEREVKAPEPAYGRGRMLLSQSSSMEGHGLDLERATVVTDIMAAFLQQIHAQLLEQHSELQQQRAMIDADLDEVCRAATRMRVTHSALGCGSSESAPEASVDSFSGVATDGKRRRTCPGVKRPSVDMLLGSSEGLGEDGAANSAPCFMRDDMDIFSCIEPQQGELEARVPQSPTDGETTAGMDARWARLEKQLPIMESMYLQRCQYAFRARETSSPVVPVTSAAPTQGGALRGHLAAFAKDLNKFSKFGKLLKHASLVQSSLHVGQASHMICSMAFGCEDHMFATAGTATRKIKLYQVAPLLRHRGEDGCLTGPRRGAAAHYPLMELEAGDKLSCISWNRYLRNYLVSSDYSGVVALWDTGKGEQVTQFAEHAKRVWAADFSILDPKLIVSGSDDATVRLWNVAEPCSALSLNLCAPVYSVKFSPTNANLLAVGCANYRSYLYDIRNTGTPLLQIAGHKKAVSYVRFLGPDQLLTASIDSTVKHWNIPASLEQGDAARLRCCYREHVNEKCFVGLDVRDDGYILAGSETNEVACYYSGLPAPVLRHSFNNGHQAAGRRPAASSVAWSTTSNLFLAANSVGSVELLEMTSC
jgi:protein suppressor of PHYA-105 1